MPDEIAIDDHYVEGESVTWEFTVEANGTAQDLTGSTIEWYLLPSRQSVNKDAILDHGSNNVTVSKPDPGAGRFDVSIDAGATDGEGGETHWQRVVITDSDGSVNKWGGKFPIDPV